MITGALLILVSMLATYALISNAKHEDEYYVATRALVPGQPVTENDVRPVAAHLGTQGERYLITTEDLAGGFTTTSVVREGQFIALDDLTPVAEIQRRTIGLPVDRSATHGITRGDFIEVWHLPSTRISGFSEVSAEPQLIATNVIVSDITDNGGGLLSVSSTTVYVDVNAEDIVALLTALGADGDFALLAVNAAQS